MLRGVESGALYLYDRETYEFMKKNRNLGGHGLVLEFVMDSDDREVLEGFQKLVNPEIYMKE